MPKQNIAKFEIHTLSTFCPVCDRKFSGKEQLVIKLMKLHMKKSHPEEEVVTIDATIDTRCKLYKEREKNDTEIRDMITRPFI